MSLRDHRAQGKPVDGRFGRWSWAFKRKAGKWVRNQFLIGKPGNPMMARWRLLQTPLFGIYVHFVYREDLDSVEHDHPWHFWSLILRGGYDEYYTDDVRMPRVNTWFRTHKRWSFHEFPLRASHRITSVRPKTTTLVFVGRKCRTWGFWDDGKFTEWTEALQMRPTEGVISTGKWDPKRTGSALSENQPADYQVITELKALDRAVRRIQNTVDPCGDDTIQTRLDCINAIRALAEEVASGQEIPAAGQSDGASVRPNGCSCGTARWRGPVHASDCRVDRVALGKTCICDGARMVRDPRDNVHRHPFLVNEGCPLHGRALAGI